MSAEMTNLLLGVISGVLLTFVGAYLSSFFERRRERRGKSRRDAVLDLHEAAGSLRELLLACVGRDAEGRAAMRAKR